MPFSPADDREAVLVFETDSQSCDRAAALIAGRVAETRGATVGVGRTYDSWLDASRTYQEAVAALSYRLIAMPGKAFRYSQAKEDDQASLAELKARREKLCRTAVSGQAIEDSLEDFFALMRAMELSPQRVRHEIDSLFASILDAFGALGVSSLAVSADLCLDYYSTVERLKTMEETRCLLVRLSSYSAKVVDLRNLHVPEWKVLDIKDYVARHYQQSLSVQKVAEGLHISASYLSKLAKRYLHASFVDYLTDYRLECARDLLGTTSLMTYEIAEKVGYPDARYFSSIFKKRLRHDPFGVPQRISEGQTGSVKFHSIQNTLIRAFAALIVFTILLLGAVSLYFLRETLVQNAESTTTQLVNQMNRVIENYVKYMDDIALVTANNEDVRSLHGESRCGFARSSPEDRPVVQGYPVGQERHRLHIPHHAGRQGHRGYPRRGTPQSQRGSREPLPGNP